MKILKVFFITFMALFSLIPVSPVISETHIQNREIAVTITITDATYDSLDQDHIENDIVVYFTLKVQNLANFPEKKTCKFIMHLKLTLPSGIAYAYTYKVICSCELYLPMIAAFYNHATEQGLYLIEITGILDSGDPSTRVGTESMYFDPPGSTPGTDPLTCILYY